MAGSGFTKLPFMKRLLILSLTIGLAAGLVFPGIASPLLGPAVFAWPFVGACLVMGLSVGTLLYLVVGIALKKQLREQLALLRPLVGAVGDTIDTIEGLEQSVQETVARIGTRLSTLAGTIDQFVPHYQILADASGYLSVRAKEGLAAAQAARHNIEGVEDKQREIASQMELLTHRTQDEAALSRELSASLEEMTEAMEHSNSRFLETTSTVDEMATSIREVAGQSSTIARSVEETARNLDSIGDSLEKIKRDAVSGAQAAEEVKLDAENGLGVVRSSIGEMERITTESQKAMAAMERLVRQTEEVGKIIVVIKELVSDTELLAFNAAIIAAQAGEEGRGFSVVAEEIRDLADRTTTSAQDIHRIVQAIAADTGEATKAVEATSERIAAGKRQSQAAGEALGKIVTSSGQAVATSAAIAQLTGEQGERARALLGGAGNSLRSVKAIAKAIQEQEIAIGRIQQGVSDMKSASDQVARGMEEQVRAKRQLDRGLDDRGGQIRSINEAVQFQMATAKTVFSHFATSEQRLKGNAERAEIINREIAALETLATRLRELAHRFEENQEMAKQR